MRKQKDIEKAALKAYKDIVDKQKNSFYNIFKAGVEYADTHSLNGNKKIDLNKEIQKWYSGSFTLPWCTVKDAIELTARHFFELGLDIKEDKE